MSLPLQFLPQGERVPFAKQVGLPAPDMGARTAAASDSTNRSRGGRRWVTLVCPGSSPVEVKQTPQESPRASRNGSQGPSGKKVLPKVPSLVQPEAWKIYRQLKVGPKSADDSYEISDREDDDEVAEDIDRSHKRVPKWANSYLDALTKQRRVDPDTIFGTKVPQCDLGVIFTDELYARCSLERPKRIRGSSGKWDKDSLKSAEINAYRNNTGQKECWTAKVRHR